MMQVSCAVSWDLLNSASIFQKARRFKQRVKGLVASTAVPGFVCGFITRLFQAFNISEVQYSAVQSTDIIEVQAPRIFRPSRMAH